MSSFPSASSASIPTGLSAEMFASLVLPNFPSLPEYWKFQANCSATSFTTSASFSAGGWFL